jgi:hypothetical protein
MQTPPFEAEDPREALTGPTFIVPHTWPETRNAEFEVLQRLAIAARNIGATMIAVDNDGRPLWANRPMWLDKSKPIDPTGIEFMISLHFESPRLLDIYSYYALWQPLDFYFQFGYEASLEKMLSHNDCLSCLSDSADAHARTTFGARGDLNPAPFPNLFHNAAQPYLEPHIDDQARLFYIGINWERLGKRKGRHAGVFEILDDAEVLDIYGPRKFLGVAPWEGFRSYRGELPFDGHSTLDAINKAGICLALSSEAHKRSGLMSNRLFEGLAAGAAVIVDSNRWAKTHFSDIVYFIDDNGSEDDVAFQIKTIVDDIRLNPEAAMDRVRRGQARLAEKFSLEGSLSKLIADHPERLKHHQATALSAGSVGVVMTYEGNSLDEILDMVGCVAAQTMVSVDLALICDATFFEAHREAIAAVAVGSIRALNPVLLNLERRERLADQPVLQTTATGPSMAAALKGLQTEYFCFIRSDERWFHDHLASLVAALTRTPSSVLGLSGALEETVHMKQTTRRLTSLRVASTDSDLLNARYASEFGRFIFARSVLEHTSLDCLFLLDGQEPNFVRLAASLSGDTARSGYATYVRNRAKTESMPAATVPLEQQQQFIRDAVAFDSRWLARMTLASRMPEHIYAYSTGAPVRFDHFQHPLGITHSLPLNELVETSEHQTGLKYLTHGFSFPESDGVWVEGDYGSIEFYCTEQTRSALQDLDLVVYLRGRPERDTGRQQHCTVVVNGVPIAYVETPDVHNTRFTFRMPRNAVSAGGHMRIQLIPDHAELVYGDKDQVVDNRRLSLHVQRFGLISRRNATRPVLTPEVTYEVGEGAEALAVLHEGFCYPERHSSWLLGKAAHLSFRVQDFAPTMRLLFWLTGREDADGAPQKVTIFLNGRLTGVFVLDGREVQIGMHLTEDTIDAGGVCAVTMLFSHARPTLEAIGGVERGRPLAAELHRIQIVDDAPPPPPPPLPPPPPPPPPPFLRRAARAILRRI